MRSGSDTSALLTDPVANMVIGQHYIDYLSQKKYIEGNVIHILAAYNAGPANLIEWQKELSHIQDPLLFIEKIPYRETRQYVQQVVTDFMIYSEMLTGRKDESYALLRGNWPTLSAAALRLALTQPDSQPRI